MHTFTIFNHEPDVRAFKVGQSIFVEGDASQDLMFAVLDGEVDIVRRQNVVATITPGGVFGEMALLDQLPRSASAVAKTDCRVAAVTEYRFTRLVLQNPQFALEMMRLLVERLRQNMST